MINSTSASLKSALLNSSAQKITSGAADNNSSGQDFAGILSQAVGSQNPTAGINPLSMQGTGTGTLPLQTPAYQSAPVSAGATTSAVHNITSQFGKAFSDVNNTIIHAENKMEKLATGEEKDIHGTMIAMEKASISFKLLSTVRNKIVSAYQEISRMQV